MEHFAHRHRRSVIERLLGVSMSVVVVLAISACTPPATPTASPSAPPSATEASGSAAATVTHSAAASPVSSPTAMAPVTPPPAPATDPTRCTASHLDAALSEGGGGAAGSRLPYIVFTNTGSATCVLHGWPGVSFVGNGNGTQIGAAADFDSAIAITTVTLAPGGKAHAPLKVTIAENFDSGDCQPSASDGFRIYAPGETHSLFIPSTDYTSCLDAGVHLLTVQAVQPGAS